LERSSITYPWGKILFFCLLATLCHCTLQVTERYAFRLTAVALMLSMYLGFKAGKWVGLAAGVLTTAPWMIGAGFALRERPDLWPQLLGGSPWYSLEFFRALHIEGISFQFLVQAAVLGSLGGWGFARIQRKLSDHLLVLSDLVPARVAKPLIQTLYRFVERFVRPKSQDPEPKRETGRQWLLTLPLVAMLVLSNIMLSSNGQLAVRFPAKYLGAVALLGCSFAAGGTNGVWLTFLVWILSLVRAILYPLSLPIGEDTQLSDGISIQTPAQAIGLAILAWWIGQFGDISRDKEKRRRLSGLWNAMTRPTAVKTHPSPLIVPALVLLSVGLQVVSGRFEFSYHPYVPLFLLASSSGYYFDHVAVSNRLFLLFALTTTVVTSILISPGILLELLPSDFYDLVALSVIPLLVSRLDLTHISNCRIATAGFFFALVVRDVFLGDGFFDLSIDTSIKSATGYAHYDFWIVSWSVHIILFLAAARLLHWMVGVMPARQSRAAE
jgi:hypothetical protein